MHSASVTIVAVLLALPFSFAGSVCFATTCTLGTPTGGAPACNMRAWGPGRKPCGDSSAFIRGFEAFDDLDGHVEVTLDDQWVTFMPRDGSPGGGVLSIHSVEYEGIDVSDGNVEQDRDEGCGFASSLENVWWPDVPVCF
ncbi:hypothetical protein IQ06DRAFT_351135 [Phaeosphaeriaceae sp. SRC1lsM3a]|nr:hypothetical protein IQ06DRAFT_351135 [Stagonospora sp. SRC1lsM3a]